MSVEWIEYKGTKILFLDHRDQEPAAVIEDLETSKVFLDEIPEVNKLRVLINTEGAIISKEVMARLKEMGKQFEPRAEKAAVVGITGIRHILLSAYNRVTGAEKHQKQFDTQEEALEWLSS